ncbi:MAG TPA: efflux RND transporter periplasmic adaptor subunit, partial [Bryobacteraceae bacterium]|nr:efflux RND transporter periplasmic adaptor subunit [Bryobacteraceae bacterium]
LTLCGGAAAQVDMVAVQSQSIERPLMIPGEIIPYQRVTLHARVNGYVERVLVDRGTSVKQGQLLVSIDAPEVAAAVAEAESRAQTAESNRAEAEARLAGLQATYDRLKTASATPGAIAGNELVQAEKNVEAARAAVRSGESAVRAAQAAVQAVKQSEQHLRILAPFSGQITERFVHPGALVGPGSGASGALLELEQLSRLRLVVPVPEAHTAGVRPGSKVPFRVPAYPGRTFTGTVARVDRSLDPKTRTMAVEIDVSNAGGQLSPGMFPEVSWSARRQGESLLVPPSAVVTTTERTFVIRQMNGRASWVDVRKGAPAGELVEVYGRLNPGDLVVRRANDEMREGTPLQGRDPKK